jgi:DNA topoisomerase-2
MAKNKKVPLTVVVAKNWKEYALYTVEERAIPSMVDGLKPSQRFILYSALKNAKDRFAKVAEIAGNVSAYGYHHGETSAQGAATAMGSDWQNNNPLLEGDGNFGTRLVQKPAAARYIFAKIHKNFYNFFMDTDLCPEHIDEDIKTPKWYLPIIPYVLLNGISGVATGFATDILPYDVKEVTKLTAMYLSGKSIDGKTLLPKFPQFTGTVERTGPKSYDVVGTFELKGKTKLLITEVPYGYDRETYVEILDTLEENGVLVNYEDQCDMNGFQFLVTLRRDFDGDIEKTFKLRKSFTENLSVIDPEGKFKIYDTPIDLIKDFCDFRLKYVQKRIEKELDILTTDMALLKAKIKFIESVIANKITFKEKSKKQLNDELIALKFKPEHIDSLLNMNFYHLTTEEIDKLGNKYLELYESCVYFKGTTAETEYRLDLEKLLKVLK